MMHKRVHIRVPMAGKALVCSDDGLCLEAQAINVSEGGIRIESLDFSPQPDVVYEFEITTTARGIVRFSAVLVYGNEEGAGFRITHIEPSELHTIFLMIADFQATEEFIRHIDEKSILNDWLKDGEGNELNITFER